MIPFFHRRLAGGRGYALRLLELNDRAVAAGLTLRPLTDTLRDTLAWERVLREPLLAMVPADRVLAAQHGWLAPLPPEGASVIVHRDTSHAPEMAQAQHVRAAELVGANRSQFMLSSAIKEAKSILLDQASIYMDAPTFQKTLDWMDAPVSPEEVAGMKRLISGGAKFGHGSGGIVPLRAA